MRAASCAFAAVVALGAAPVATLAQPEQRAGSASTADSVERAASTGPKHIVHGVYPGGPSAQEDDVKPRDLRSYERLVGKDAAWVYFSDNWYRNERFPTWTAQWVRKEGAVPFVRLMMRTDSNIDRPERKYTLQRIIDGRFDPALRRWFADARRFRTRVMVDFGVEMNGSWFSWNGWWNGRGRKDGFGSPRQYDGPERFRAAYRHIVRVSRQQGAHNIRWVFHVNVDDSPRRKWNRMERYFPGHRYVDAVAVSLYGVQTPRDDWRVNFRAAMDRAYPRLVRIADGKPLYLAEFGAAQHPEVDQAAWARRALTDLAARRWPRISGISWWNEHWENDENPAHDTTMRLQDNPRLAGVFAEIVGQDPLFIDHLPGQR